MAGLLGAFLPGLKDNPFYTALDQNRNALGGLSAGLLQGKDFSEGLAQGADNAMRGRVVDSAYQQQQQAQQDRLKALNSTVSWMKQAGYGDLVSAVDAGALTPSDAFNEAFKRQAAAKAGAGDGRIAADANTRASLADQYGLSGDDKTAFVLTGNLPTGRGAASEVSLQPTWLVGADGQPILGQMTKGGEVVATRLPDGAGVMDPRQLSGVRAAGAIDGKTQATAQAALPNAQLTAQQTIGVIDQLRKDQQGLEETFGRVAGTYPQQWAPTIPGTAKANYAALLNQAKGKVFLQAYQSLRGGGAITEIEGLKAEQALARLDTAQSKEAYLKALDDFEQAVRDGLAKLQTVAGGGGSVQPMGGSPSGGGADPLGIR